MKKKVFRGIGIAQIVIWVVLLILVVGLTIFGYYDNKHGGEIGYMMNVFLLAISFAILLPLAIAGAINAVVNLLLINRIFTPSISKSEKVRNIVLCILADLVLYGFIVSCFFGIGIKVQTVAAFLGVWVAITLLAVFSLVASKLNDKKTSSANNAIA